jgi:hypothetical protein
MGAPGEAGPAGEAVSPTLGYAAIIVVIVGIVFAVLALRKALFVEPRRRAQRKAAEKASAGRPAP